MKIAFMCGDLERFLVPIFDHVAKSHEIKRFKKGTVREMFELMKWADVCWFEWCSDMIVEASQLPKVTKTICRLHRYEAFHPVVHRVDWEYVDRLVTVSDGMGAILKNIVPDVSKTTVETIYNGIDLDKFTYRERGHGNKIAYTGYLNYRKNPVLMLQCLKAAMDVNPDIELHIAGQFQDQELHIYFEYMAHEMGIRDRIYLNPWTDNVNAFLEDKDYFLSTSTHEGCGYSIMEAMAKGIKPLIHNFSGARELYPGVCLFNDVKQFTELLKSDYESSVYRGYIADSFPLSKQLADVDRLLAAI
jgi:glycosyltransferase involved in cell wall biosynthesis